jgi:hypothetical protein
VIDSPADWEQEPGDADVPLPPEVTPELFRVWRSPRFGRSNPEPMNNPVWDWLIRSKVHAYTANELLNGPDSLDAGPGWCFDRFGQSSTQLTDGRIVLIGGEHEDFYDSDFYIYNDVVVRYPDDRIDIYGYPRDVFPPTDSHSATVVGNRIIIIGCLGYPEQRRPGTTPVMSLNVDTMAISNVVTTGISPGWLHDHSASLSEDGTSILVQRGKIDRRRERMFVENIDDWRLYLEGWRWERLTERQWPRWELRRQDGRPNHLWEIQHALWYHSLKDQSHFEERMEELTLELGKRPDLELAETLFCPGIPHEKLPDNEDEWRVHRINIHGVVVRYVEDSHSIQTTVEGSLPQETLETLASDLTQKLATLENTPYELKQI